jgi:uncharacterized protein YcbX
MRIGSVQQLWRYPVKSLAGERVRELSVDHRGVESDRMWALVDRDGGIASGKTTRRFRKVPGLLRHSSRLDRDGPVVTVADGSTARPGTAEIADLIETMAGPGWSLQREAGISHFDAGAVHLVTTATLETLCTALGEPLPVERLRPNLLLDVGEGGFPEDEWIGQVMRFGEAELHVVSRVERCVMVNHAQSLIPPRRDILKTIGRVNRACAGVYADVVVPGRIGVGDLAALLPADGSAGED